MILTIPCLYSTLICGTKRAHARSTSFALPQAVNQQPQYRIHMHPSQLQIARTRHMAKTSLPRVVTPLIVCHTLQTTPQNTRLKLLRLPNLLTTPKVLCCNDCPSCIDHLQTILIKTLQALQLINLPHMAPRHSIFHGIRRMARMRGSLERLLEDIWIQTP